MHLNATDGILVQKSVKVGFTSEKIAMVTIKIVPVHTRGRGKV